MDLSLRAFCVAVVVATFLVSFKVGGAIIRADSVRGRPSVDLLAAIFSGMSLANAVLSFLPLIRIHNEKLIFNYSIDSEPSLFLIFLPLFLAISLALSLSKRWEDYRLAGAT